MVCRGVRVPRLATSSRRCRVTASLVRSCARCTTFRVTLRWTGPPRLTGKSLAVSRLPLNCGSAPIWVWMASLSQRVLCPCTTASLLVSPSALRTAPFSPSSSCPSPSATRSRLGVTATTRAFSTRQPRSIPTVSLPVGSSRCPRVPSRDSSPHQHALLVRVSRVLLPIGGSSREYARVMDFVLVLHIPLIER